MRTLRTMTITLLSAFLLAVAIVAAGASGDSATPNVHEDMAQALRAVLEQNMKSLNDKSPDLGMAAIHSQSPVYDATRNGMKRCIGNYDVRFELQSFSYIGRDVEYAVARVSQKTKRISGPAFRDNIVDVMHIFRQEYGKWKIWQSAVLSVTYLDEPASQPASAPSDPL